jgi:hypothetical protein
MGRADADIIGVQGGHGLPEWMPRWGSFAPNGMFFGEKEHLSKGGDQPPLKPNCAPQGGEVDGEKLGPNPDFSNTLGPLEGKTPEHNASWREIYATSPKAEGTLNMANFISGEMEILHVTRPAENGRGQKRPTFSCTDGPKKSTLGMETHLGTFGEIEVRDPNMGTHFDLERIFLASTPWNGDTPNGLGILGSQTLVHDKIGRWKVENMGQGTHLDSKWPSKTVEVQRDPHDRPTFCSPAGNRETPPETPNSKKRSYESLWVNHCDLNGLRTPTTGCILENAAHPP